MPRLNKSDLLQQLIRAVRQAGWSVSYDEVPPHHPFRLLISRDEKSLPVQAYIWNITPGGNNRPKDEFRIQLTGVNTIEIIPGIDTLLLGYWEANDLFAGWDANKHHGQIANSPSLQIREDYLLKANLDGFAVYPKANDEVAVAFRPDLFITYLENLNEFHAAVSAQEQAVLTRVTEQAGQLAEVDLQELPIERQRVVRTIAQNQRASDFRKRVLAAYENSCAICGIQLDLVDAAHIVPVRHPDSTDNTSNGLCLCALHHRAFDSGLVAILPDYRIVVNGQKFAQLKALDLVGGTKVFLGHLRQQIRLPAEPGLRPTAQTIGTALRVRELNIIHLKVPKTSLA